MTAGLLAGFLVAQISAGAIVARVKEQERRIEELEAVAELTIHAESESKKRRFRLALLREGVSYRALFEILEPREMAGTKFLVYAERGKRNKQWAYFPDLDLVRAIPGRRQDDPFLSSDITYADLAGGAHLDDLLHRLVGEEILDGVPCYVLEGTPRHEIVYGKLRGWVRKTDFVIVRAEFYDREGRLMKRARLTDVRDLGGGILLAHRIEVRSAAKDSVSVLKLEDVRVNQGPSAEDFTPEALKESTEP